MAVTLTAVLLTASDPQPAQVTLSGTSAGQAYTITGTTTDGASWTIPGGVGISNGAQVVVTDNRAALNVAVTYRAVVAGVTYTAAPLTIAWPGVGVLQTLDGQTIVDIEIASVTEKRKYPIRGSVFEIANRADPAARLDVAGSPQYEWMLDTQLSDTAVMESILTSGRPIIRRLVPGMRDLKSVIIGIVLDWSDELLTQGADTWRRFTITVREIPDPQPSAALAAYGWADFDTAMSGRIWSYHSTLAGTLAAALGPLTPFETTPAAGVTVAAVAIDSAPSWVGSGVGALWDDAGKFAFHAGTPVEVLAGAGHTYGCAVRSTGADNLSPIQFSTRVTATKFAVMVTSWAVCDVTVWVDRKPVQASTDPVLTTGTGYQLIVVDGLSAGAHQVDVLIGTGANFLQLLVPSGGTITAGAVPAVRIGLVGDSYFDAGLPPYFGGLLRELVRLTGWSIIHLGQGSTGYTNDGSSSGDATKSVYGSASRIAALVAANVDGVLAGGSVNDAGSPPATVAAAVTSWAAAVRTAIGPRPVVIAGVEPLNLPANDPSTWDALNAAILTAARSASNVVAVIDWRAERWLTGTGSVSAPQGNGNQDQLIGTADGSDTIHPNFAGQKVLAARFAAALASATVPALSGLTATNGVLSAQPTGGYPDGAGAAAFGRLTIATAATAAAVFETVYTAAAVTLGTPVVPGMVITVTIRVKGTPGRAVTAAIKWSGGSISSGTAVTLTGSWQQVSVTATAPAGTTGLAYGMQVAATGVAAGDTADWDAVTISPGPDVPIGTFDEMFSTWDQFDATDWRQYV